MHYTTKCTIIKEVPHKEMTLTSILRISIDKTERKKNICRKKSDISATTATRQNSCIAGENVKKPHTSINIHVINVLNMYQPSLLIPVTIVHIVIFFISLAKFKKY